MSLKFPKIGKFPASLKRVLKTHECHKGPNLHTNSLNNILLPTVQLTEDFLNEICLLKSHRFANSLTAEYVYNGCFFKFGVEVGVEESIVNALPDYN
jgi:hypothetical protein